ncbi:MAG: aspartate/glutamate racemase family protein, partial [Acidobacteriales bacterium]|nr:aspartate/glutamate racemase family protein [Terriglobales bacterium]
GARNASNASKLRQAVVIGTAATVNSHAYHRALAELGMQCIEKACPLLVPLIEEGWIDHSVTESVAGIYLGEAFESGPQADVLVLGCTHYPLIKPLLGRIAPQHLAIIDSAEATAEVVRDKVGSKAASDGRYDAADLRFFATDSEEKFQALGARFLGRPIGAVQHVDLKE